MEYTYTDEQLKKLQELELMILEEVASICDRHNLDYFLFGGTGIGAVRHEGFIPWDDDVDIAMFRDDYEKLLDIMDEELDSKFYVIALERQEECFLPYAKVCLKNTRFENWWAKQVPFEVGIFIDIFPLENVPKSKFKRAIYHYRCLLLDHIVMNSLFKITTGSKPIDLIHKVFRGVLKIIPISTARWKRMYYNALTKYKDDETDRVTCYFSHTTTSRFGKYDYYFKSEFLPAKEFKFEDSTFLGPNDMDMTLKRSYNDYMQLPPEDKRVNHAPDVLDFGDY